MYVLLWRNAQGPTPWNYKPHCGAFCFVSQRVLGHFHGGEAGPTLRQLSLLKDTPAFSQGALGHWENHWISSLKYYQFSALCCLQFFRHSDEKTVLSCICKSISEICFHLCIKFAYRSRTLSLMCPWDCFLVKFFMRWNQPILHWRKMWGVISSLWLAGFSLRVVFHFCCHVLPWECRCQVSPSTASKHQRARELLSSWSNVLSFCVGSVYCFTPVA